jgi:ABC-type amino acid transport system permease subunit
MNSLIGQLQEDFFPRLLSGMAVNFEIAGIAIAVGLVLGMPLAYARVFGGAAGMLLGQVIALLRAAPTFVVMYFLLNVIPTDLSLFGHVFRLSGVMIVALSLVPYSAYYVADNGLEALRQLSSHSPLAALLFLPNLARAFFVLVMSSSVGAAIGVSEGITVILRQAERLPLFVHRLELFGIGILLFGITLQGGLAAVNVVRRHLGAALARRTSIRL